MLQKVIICAMLLLPFAVLAQAQTQVDVSAVLGQGVQGEKIGLRFQGSFLPEFVKGIRTGLQVSDRNDDVRLWGPMAILSLGSWGIPATTKLVGGWTIGGELIGWTDINNGFDFTNGVVGCGLLFDRKADNRLQGTLKVLWRDDGLGNQDILVTLGSRVDLEL